MIPSESIRWAAKCLCVPALCCLFLGCDKGSNLPVITEGVKITNVAVTFDSLSECTIDVEATSEKPTTGRVNAVLEFDWKGLSKKVLQEEVVFENSTTGRGTFHMKRIPTMAPTVWLRVTLTRAKKQIESGGRPLFGPKASGPMGADYSTKDILDQTEMMEKPKPTGMPR